MCLYYLPFYFFTFLLNHPLFTIINVDTLRRRLRGELATLQVVPAVTSYIFHIPSYINNSRCFAIAAEVQNEGVNLLLWTFTKIHVEVATEGIHDSVGAGIVEFVACSDVENALVLAGECLGVVVADELHLAVGALHSAWTAALDVAAVEGRRSDRITRCRPLHEAGHASIYTRGCQEVQV